MKNVCSPVSVGCMTEAMVVERERWILCNVMVGSKIQQRIYIIFLSKAAPLGICRTDMTPA